MRRNLIGLFGNILSNVTDGEASQMGKRATLGISDTNSDCSDHRLRSISPACVVARYPIWLASPSVTLIIAHGIAVRSMTL
jgi:hypothetical protein